MNETYKKLFFETTVHPLLIFTKFYFETYEKTVKLFFPEVFKRS